MNNLITIENVRGYLDETTGTAYLNAEDVARGFGFTYSQTKNGKEYSLIRWNRVNSYLQEFGYSATCGGNNIGEKDFIPENMVYRLGFKASNEVAQKFQGKLADEIIPSIRKHGAYMTKETLYKAITSPDFLIGLANELKKEKELKEAAYKQIEADKPKTIFANAVSSSRTSILIGELAKLIKQNGIDIGRDRLFSYLRANGYLLRAGESWNMPSQYSMRLGLMEIKEHTSVNPDGSIRVTKTPKVTGKGQIYFVNHFLQKKQASQA